MSRICFLAFGKYGDVSIHWEPQNDDKVLPVIQNMIDRGVRFFVLNKKKRSDAPVSQVDHAVLARSIVIPDDELERLHQAGLIGAGSVVLDDEIDDTESVAGTAEEVAENETVAVPGPSGG